ncbi:MAG: hypothetical protein CVT92_05500 [Bacteroidetes bacterium HGW-Bacteroidetes-1]|jgi:hypothetical protein|nr:MAG: hypothetical protein CVT92_05500 [Bacteroidetes bacterium HGW-Bacteroidetes-1]
MKHQNVFWGTILISSGLFLLLDRLGYCDFDWWAVGKLWPFLLILWGVSILPVQGFIKLLLALVIIVLSVFMYARYADAPRESGAYYHYRHDDEDDGEDTYSNQEFREIYNDSILKASLSMDAAAGIYKLNGTTGELIFAENKGNNTRFDFKVQELNNEAKITLKQRSDIQVGKNKGSRFDLMLNPNPVWSFDFDIGAAEFDFNFSDFKVEKIDIDGGAASIKVTLGELFKETHISIDAGASSINVTIPEGAGCKIEGSSVLSSRNLDGFEKMSKGHYQTANFETASQKIYIRMDAAVSSFTVKRR